MSASLRRNWKWIESGAMHGFEPRTTRSAEDLTAATARSCPTRGAIQGSPARVEQQRCRARKLDPLLSSTARSEARALVRGRVGGGRRSRGSSTVCMDQAALKGFDFYSPDCADLQDLPRQQLWQDGHCGVPLEHGDHTDSMLAANRNDRGFRNGNKTKRTAKEEGQRFQA
jgi:hypothetical protein